MPSTNNFDRDIHSADAGRSIRPAQSCAGARRSGAMLAIMLTVMVACSGDRPVVPSEAADGDPRDVGFGPGEGKGSAGGALSCGLGGSSPGNPYPCCDNLGNCTWYVWKEASALWGSQLSTRSWGNAGSWYVQAQADGYPVGRFPAPGAIAVLNIGSVGHVGVVSAVSCGSSTSITLSEMNCCERNSNYCGHGSLPAASAQGVAGPRLKTYSNPASWIGFIYPKGATPPLQCSQSATSSGIQTSVAVSPSNLVVPLGEARSVVVSVLNQSSQSGSVDLSVSGLTGTSFSFTPTRLTIPANQVGLGQLEVATTATSPLGTSTVTLEARSGSGAGLRIGSTQLQIGIIAPTYTIALSANPSAGGSVSGAGTFASGSLSMVTATANSGYTFTNWTENGITVSTNASYTFTLNANRALVANFTAAPAPSLVVNPSETARGYNSSFVFVAVDSVLITVSNTGSGAFTWSASSSASWLTLRQVAGTVSGGASQQFWATIDWPVQKNVEQSGTITVSAPGATGSPRTVLVRVSGF